jgi:signal transduction histidine kinase
MLRRLSLRVSPWVAWTAVVITVLMNGAASGIGRLVRPYLGGMAAQATQWFQLTPIFSEAFAIVGALIVWRRPGNRVGWVCLGIGVSFGLEELTLAYSAFAMHGNLAAAGLANWLAGWVWILPVILGLFFLPFLFPDGKPVSPRWWWLPWVAVGSMTATMLAATVSLPGLTVVAQVLGMASDVLGPTALVIRYRRSSPEQRQQIKWFAGAAVLLAVIGIAGLVVSITVYHNPYVVFNPIFGVLVPIGLMILALSIGVSVFRYHLYDIDVFLRRALVYAALVVVISIVYLIAVVAIGQNIDLPKNADAERAIPFVVAAVIALLFQPARNRLQRLANSLVYGRRATPYEVLANLSRSMAEMSAAEDVPRRMARALAEGTEADRAEVWLHVGDTLRLAAAWPESPTPIPPLRGGAERPNTKVDAAQLDATMTAPVRYQGEELGVLAVMKREPMTPIEARLVNDLAHEAGLALKNVRLTAELLQRLDELAASRKRLVTAQDTERRRLERDLHDGAQQQLIALKLKLGLARNLAARDPAQLSAMLEELAGEASGAIETMRELARGLYPPILADSGLTAALEAQARRSPLPIDIRADSLRRYAPEAEAAVYFCCLEALQNAAKHAHANAVTVTLEDRDGCLHFEVTDDGVGVDPAHVRSGSGIQNMADRLAALGGSLDVRAGRGGGTTVSGELPVQPRAEVSPPDGAIPALRTAS